MAVQIQQRRDTAANWTSANPVLAEGEVGWELDTGKAKLGNGADDWATLPYAVEPGGGGIPDAPSDGDLYARKDGDWEQIPSGAGDVVGPAGATAERVAVFDGGTGKLIKDGGVTIPELVEQARIAPENVQTGTTYTLVLADAFKLVAMDNSSANTLTVPPESSVDFPLGTRIDLSQDGAGQTTIAAGPGVTIRSPETLKIRKQYGKASLIKRATNTWDLEGNLEAVP